MENVRCKLFKTCEKKCRARKPHPKAACKCRCVFNKIAKCVPCQEFGAQDFMLSEAEEKMQVPGPAAARNTMQ